MCIYIYIENTKYDWSAIKLGVHPLSKHRLLSSFQVRNSHPHSKHCGTSIWFLPSELLKLEAKNSIRSKRSKPQKVKTTDGCITTSWSNFVLFLTSLDHHFLQSVDVSSRTNCIARPRKLWSCWLARPVPERPWVHLGKLGMQETWRVSMEENWDVKITATTMGIRATIMAI